MAATRARVKWAFFRPPDAIVRAQRAHRAGLRHRVDPGEGDIVIDYSAGTGILVEHFPERTPELQEGYVLVDASPKSCPAIVSQRPTAGTVPCLAVPVSEYGGLEAGQCV